ncbi:MAG: PDZ domain-containing protein [Chloroherpetonaceae bacterium]|nr:PDZ domain-containing protein [Chloroherpetonaceae bacterium]MDW8436787.1 PDZ domain-containing protein [Chloroherpetonaceae bacterium]
MKSLSLILSLLFVMPTALKAVSKKKPSKAFASDKFAAEYRIESLEPNLHMFLVTVTVQNPDAKPTIDFILPAWRPGRYQIQNYAANVQEFSARSGNEALAFEKIDKQTWRVYAQGKPEVTAQYKYFAGGQIDAGNCYVGRDEMYFNGSNLFVYTDETRFKPVRLRIDYPTGWKVATQLERTDDPRVFIAETYDDLIDAPTLVSPTLIQFQFKVKSATIRACFKDGAGLGGYKFNEENIKRDLAAIVEAQFDLMRDVPFKEYFFIYHILPISFAHGVEHKNSTSIVLGPADKMNENYSRFLSISSHEFFHVWNIKRIKPKEFIPYDYTKEVYTPMLYVSEGFTSYYGDLTLVRGKVWSPRTYLNDVADGIANLQSTFGRKVQSLALSSFDAWLSGYGAGRANSTVSFYGKGELVGLILDLELRQRSRNKHSLDDVMRHLNEEFAKKNRGFSASDFQGVVEKFAGGSMREFFDKYVYGTEELPFETALSYAGLELRKTLAPQPYSGIASGTENDFPVVKSVVPESPAAKIGLDNGDMLIALNGDFLMKQSLSSAFSRFKAGDSVKVTFQRDGKLHEKTMRLEGSYDYSIVKKKNPTRLERDILESWLACLWDEI